jgi:hypothetical protein
MLSGKDPDVLMAMRDLLTEGQGGTLAEALDREGEYVTSILTTPEFQQRLETFTGRNR